MFSLKKKKKDMQVHVPDTSHITNIIPLVKVTSHLLDVNYYKQYNNKMW